MTDSKKGISTFDKEMQNPTFRKKFEKEYKKFLLSELIITLMEDNSKSVRGLAEEVGISPTVIQKIRSGEQEDIKLSNLISISHAFGYRLVMESDDKRILLC